jgi:translation initiation factor 4E
MDTLVRQPKQKTSRRYTSTPLTPAGQWEANLKEIIQFESIEDFWGVVAHAKSPLDLPYGSNYHLFRTGVKPAWEDAKNTGGGKWTLNVPRGKRDLMNEAWILMVRPACLFIS